MKLFCVSALLVVVVAGSVACDNSGSSATATATAPTGAATTDIFTGTVPVGGLDFKPFTVTQNNGLLSVTLTAAGPPATITMGLGVGTVTGTTCTLLSGASTSAPAGITPQLSGTIGAGSYCVEVVDIGNAALPITYSVTVVHF